MWSCMCRFSRCRSAVHYQRTSPGWSWQDTQTLQQMDTPACTDMEHRCHESLQMQKTCAVAHRGKVQCTWDTGQLCLACAVSNSLPFLSKPDARLHYSVKRCDVDTPRDISRLQRAGRATPHQSGRKRIESCKSKER